VQAIGATQSLASEEMTDSDGDIAGAARERGAGALGGVGAVTRGISGSVGSVARTTGGAVDSTVGGSVGVATRSAGAVGGGDAAGRLVSGSKGVFGLRDLSLASSSAGSAEGSVITSAARNVRLESGTNLLLVTSAQAEGNGVQKGPVK